MGEAAQQLAKEQWVYSFGGGTAVPNQQRRNTNDENIGGDAHHPVDRAIQLAFADADQAVEVGVVFNGHIGHGDA